MTALLYLDSKKFSSAQDDNSIEWGCESPTPNPLDLDPAPDLEQVNRELRAALEALRRETSEQPGGAADTQLKLPKHAPPRYSWKADDYRLWS